jgi:hypothetical protein
MPMKKLLFLLLSVIAFIGCEKEPIDKIEGKWLWSYNENRADASRMYEFANGFQYTYHSLDSSFNQPDSVTYTFDGKNLIIDGESLKFQFECNGDELTYWWKRSSHTGERIKLWRLNSNCQ